MGGGGSRPAPQPTIVEEDPPAGSGESSIIYPNRAGTLLVEAPGRLMRACLLVPSVDCEHALILPEPHATLTKPQTPPPVPECAPGDLSLPAARQAPGETSPAPCPPTLATGAQFPEPSTPPLFAPPFAIPPSAQLFA